MSADQQGYQMSEHSGMQKWTVEFWVDDSWVEDGFDLTDERALDMLSNDLGYATIGTELDVKVISKPSKTAIQQLQSDDTYAQGDTEI